MSLSQDSGERNFHLARTETPIHVSNGIKLRYHQSVISIEYELLNCLSRWFYHNEVYHCQLNHQSCCHWSLHRVHRSDLCTSLEVQSETSNKNIRLLEDWDQAFFDPLGHNILYSNCIFEQRNSIPIKIGPSPKRWSLHVC